MAAPPFRKIEHDAARSTLDLIGGLGAVPPKLRDHGAKGANQIQRDVIGNEHVFSWRVSFLEWGTPSADDLRGWAPPVATDPRQDP